MLFDEFIKQYVEDLIECSDKKYNLTDEDKKRLIEDLRYDDYLWKC